jgi:2-polyprenyl-3-methyl-5-hydroxy-6-metoxy-1,4-benzoquinol methylase
MQSEAGGFGVSSTAINPWLVVKEGMRLEPITLGSHVSYWMRHSPRRLLYSQSYYKFAGKLIGPGRSVLDLGCGEGLGTWVLAKECGRAQGVDFDAEAIAAAKTNWQSDAIQFSCEDFFEARLGRFDAIVALDVIEHIPAEQSEGWIRMIQEHLTEYGIAILGTPNITAQQYASEVARAGHVNLYSGDRLRDQLKRHFHQVFLFGANDEVVHTGYLPMAHYLIAVCCRKRQGGPA